MWLTTFSNQKNIGSPYKNKNYRVVFAGKTSDFHKNDNKSPIMDQMPKHAASDRPIIPSERAIFIIVIKLF